MAPCTINWTTFWHHIPLMIPSATNGDTCHSMHHTPLNVPLNFQISPADKPVVFVIDCTTLNYTLLASQLTIVFITPILCWFVLDMYILVPSRPSTISWCFCKMPWKHLGYQANLALSYTEKSQISHHRLSENCKMAWNFLAPAKTLGQIYRDNRSSNIYGTSELITELIPKYSLFLRILQHVLYWYLTFRKSCLVTESKFMRREISDAITLIMLMMLHILVS